MSCICQRQQFRLSCSSFCNVLWYYCACRRQEVKQISVGRRLKYFLPLNDGSLNFQHVYCFSSSCWNSSFSGYNSYMAIYHCCQYKTKKILSKIVVLRSVAQTGRPVRNINFVNGKLYFANGKLYFAFSVELLSLSWVRRLPDSNRQYPTR